MTDIAEDLARAPAAPPALARSLARELVVEAPADYDAVMAQLPVLPGWARVSLIVGFSAAGWAAIIAGAALLLR